MRITEIAKSVVIFALCVVMMLLLVLLMLDHRSVQNESLLPEDRMVVYESGAATGYFEGMDHTRVIPERIACRNGGALECLYASENVAKAYEVLYPLIDVLFGQGSGCCQLPQSIGDALWKGCSVEPRLFYLRYHGALPVSVIRAYTFSSTHGADVQMSVLNETTMGDSAYIKELFFIEADSLDLIIEGAAAALSDDVQASEYTTVSAVARDDNGNVFVFTADQEQYQRMMDLLCEGDGTLENGTSADEAEAIVPGLHVPRAENEFVETDVRGDMEPIRTLSAYIDDARDHFSNANTAAFFSEREGSIPLFSEAETALWMDGVYELPQLQTKQVRFHELLFFDETTNSSAKNVLSLLGVRNKDTDNYYTDTQGDRVYLNAEGRLVFSHDGMIDYTAMGDGGLSVADYLGYASIGGNYRLSEYLCAADSLLSLLKEQNAALCGGDLQCMLYSVGMIPSDGYDVIVITYVYTAGGIAVTDEHGVPIRALTLEASGSMIRRLQLCSANVMYTDTFACVLPQSIVADAIRLEAGDAISPEHNIGADVDVPPVDGMRGEFRLCYLWDIRGADTDTVLAAEWVLRE